MHKHFSRPIAVTGSISMADQVVVSGTNFILNIFLARFLPIKEYGLVVVAFTILFLVTAIQSALTGYPMLVIGTDYEQTDLSDYISSTFYIQLIFSLTVSVAALSLVYILTLAWNITAINNLWVFVFFGFLYTGQQFFRRVLYLLDRVGKVFWIDSLFSLILFSGLLFFFHKGSLGLMQSLWVLVVGAICSYGLGLIFIEDYLIFRVKGFRDAASKNWSFGKWLIGQSLCSWCSGQIYYVLSAIFLDLRAPAVLKVCANLLAPLHVMFQGLDNILTVAFSRRLKETMVKARALMVRSGILIVSFTAGYCLLISLFPEKLLDILYGGLYRDLNPIVWIFASAYLFRGIARVPEIGLISLHATKDMFYIFFVTMVIAIITAYPLLRFGQTMGAAVGTVFIPYLVWAILSLWRANGAFKTRLVLSEAEGSL